MLRYSFEVGVPNIRPQLLNYGDPTVKTSEIGFFSMLRHGIMEVMAVSVAPLINMAGAKVLTIYNVKPVLFRQPIIQRNKNMNSSTD
jgi:hypothetical protein